MVATVRNSSDETFDLTRYSGDWEGRKPSQVVLPGQSTVFSCEGYMSAKASAEFVSRESKVRITFSVGINRIQKGAGWAIPEVSQNDIFNVYARAGRDFATFEIKNWPE